MFVNKIVRHCHSCLALQYFAYFRSKQTKVDGIKKKLITSQHMSLWYIWHMLKVALETSMVSYQVRLDSLMFARAFIHTHSMFCTGSEGPGAAAHTRKGPLNIS